MIKRLGLPLILIALYIVLVAFDNRRHLWHDELYTFYISSAPTLAALWKDLQIDLNPPLLYLLARGSMSLFGNTPFAVRLPSMLALAVASMCLYTLVQKRLNSSAYSALAVLVFWPTSALYFATEARPYALILGFFGLALVAWCNQRPLLLALAVSGMMLSHFFAVFFLAPFLVAEAVRLFRSKQIRWTILAALLVPCVLPFFFLKVHTGDAFPHALQAGLRKMASYYYWTLRDEAWLLLGGLLAAFLFRRKINPKHEYSPMDAAFVLTLLLLPILINAVMMVLHGAFFTRYAAPALFAIPIVFVALFAAWTNKNQPFALALSAAFAVYLLWHQSRPLPKHPDFSQIHPELPLVAASGLTFLEMDHEEPPVTVNRLFYLTDRELALSYAHATIFEGLPATKQRLPIRAHVEPFAAFTQAHHEFLVLGTPEYAEDWLLRYLKASGAKLQFLGEFPSEYKDSKLFLVDL